VTAAARSVVVDERSVVNGQSAGTPVPVRIEAGALLLSTDSAILTDAPDFTADNTVVRSVEAPAVGLVSPDDLLRPLCGVRVGDVSSFLTNSRGGLPTEPGGFAVPTPAAAGEP